jgi:hypothetical protein
MKAVKILMCFLLTSQLAAAGVVNGEFSNNLANWDSLNVTVSSGEAILSDGSGLNSRLFQGVGLAAGQYTVEFDFLNQLSAEVPPGSFLDTFFASLYFIDDINLFDLDALAFDDALPLFDLDAGGPFLYQGSVGSSSLGNDWSHYTAVFNNTFNYAIPTFELFNLNSIDDDSRVLIDNVVINAVPPNSVPEPATLGLLIAGLSACRKSVRKKNR